MVCVGIDVAKDKHDCFIISSEGEILADVFTIPNNAEGFDTLLQAIRRSTRPEDKIKVGLEATGHYSYNILGFLLDKGLPTYVINPLHTNLYRKSLSLRKTKTDRVDARTIAAMLMSDVNLKSYTDTVYHNEELKSLTRYRFDKVRERAKLKQSVSRLVTILFPELEKLVSSLHSASVYALLSEFPGAKQISSTHMTHLKAVLKNASQGRYGQEMAETIRNAARSSVGSVMPAKSLELQHTIRLIRELDAEIEDIETAIQAIVDEMQSPITTIPGMGVRMGAVMSDVNLKSYTDTVYHNEELKSLTRYRFDKVRERAKLKQSVSRLVTILFPELEKLVSSLHSASVYALLSEFPGAKQISSTHMTHLKAVLKNASQGRYGQEMAETIRNAARSSVGSVMPAKSLELQHTIRLIRELDAEIEDIETAIQAIVDEMQSPITTIPGMGVRMGAVILAEIGDFSRFDSPDKILAYAGMSPSTYQSGQLSLSGAYSHMEKRGSRYLRYALYNATKHVCHWDPTFAAYLAKKRAEGKHYNVALSHAAKKLVRLIFAMEKSQRPYCAAA